MSKIRLNKQQITTISIAASGAVVVGLLIYFLFFYKKREQNSNSATAFPLKKGSSGTNVSELQQKLNSRMQLLVVTPFTYNGVEKKSIAVDGIFGSETEAAVKWALGTTSVTEKQFNSL